MTSAHQEVELQDEHLAKHLPRGHLSGHKHFSTLSATPRCAKPSRGRIPLRRAPKRPTATSHLNLHRGADSDINRRKCRHGKVSRNLAHTTVACRGTRAFLAGFASPVQSACAALLPMMYSSTRLSEEPERRTRRIHV